MKRTYKIERFSTISLCQRVKRVSF